MSRLRKGNRFQSMPHLLFGGAPIVAATVNLGDITIGTTPATPDTQSVEYATLTATGAVPNSSGAFKVTVTNVGGTEPGTEFTTIDVNGETVAVGGSIVFEVYTDETTQYFCPAVTVTIPAGGAARYAVIYP